MEQIWESRPCSPLSFPSFPFQHVGEQDPMCACSCNHIKSWNDAGVGGFGSSWSPKDVNSNPRFATAEQLRESQESNTTLLWLFSICTLREVFDQRSPVKALLAHLLNKGSHRKHLGYVPEVQNQVFNSQGSWEWIHTTQVHNRPMYKTKMLIY